MNRLTLLTLAVAALFATVGAASAQMYNSGPGYGMHMDQRYDRNYRRDNDDWRYRGRHHRRTANGCPPHYTVQDGVCKPYRGY